MLLLLSSLLVLLVLVSDVSTACTSWSSRYKKHLTGVCVCNVTHCDTLSKRHGHLLPGQVGVYTTSKSGHRFTYHVVTVTPTPVAKPTLRVNHATTYQTILGFGGTFTDATAINVDKLTDTLQDTVLMQYFSTHGLEYSIGRVPIASTDFSTRVYSYNDHPGDLAHKQFSIDVDRETHKLELIQRALDVASQPVRLFASSWAPPAWMTTTNSTINCALIGEPGTTYWQSLALYYSKFLRAYAREGIRFWAMTVQNEPTKILLQASKWQSLRMSAKQQRDFIKLDLGPLLARRHPDVLLIAGDDQKSSILKDDAPFQDAQARQYLSGLGVHWYKNLDFFFFGRGGDYKKLQKFQKKYPDMFVLATEACEGYLPPWLGTGAGPSLLDVDKSWQRAENYAHDMIENTNHFVAGWTDWNLVLDTKGGPNWAQNYVDAPLLVEADAGVEFYKQPMFYILGHFSKLVPPGSKRIDLVRLARLRHVYRCAFVTPEQHIVLQFLNYGNAHAIVHVQQPDDETFTLKIPAHSMQTAIFPAVDDRERRGAMFT
ncbi:hypothetical protein PsorP6_015697 [Peronosclerospora sorghi]|uniref:Uncharacterized protein n=1 Tax=Peronosclerospora sorghi TaxID=230839 RepID=A0ACC0WNQ1_9STRA|nr:hypothetical protein PsorP6_015697 [Peronosclerospora sorghi]